jgi:hypothetical protein
LNPGACFQVSILNENHQWVNVYQCLEIPKISSEDFHVKTIQKNCKIKTSCLRFEFDGPTLRKEKYQISNIFLLTRMKEEKEEKVKMMEKETKDFQHAIMINPIFLKDSLFSDFTLKLKDHSISFPTHKIVLATHSVFFEGKLKDPTFREQELTGVNLKTFKCIYEYMYTNQIKLDEEIIPLVLTFASKYKFKALYDVLSSKFVGSFKSGNLEEFFTNDPFEKEYFVFLDEFVEKNLNGIVSKAKKFTNQFLQYLNVFIESHNLVGILEREKAKNLMKRLMDIKLTDENSTFVEELIEKLDNFVNK